jgi:tRNA 2-thiouridine synthesizing protein B
MTLHIISKSPYQDRSLQDCLSICNEADELLLIEDAVYAAIDGSPFASEINDAGIIYYALSADINARGLASSNTGLAQLISDSEFVDLTVKHRAIQSWY